MRAASFAISALLLLVTATGCATDGDTTAPTDDAVGGATGAATPSPTAVAEPDDGDAVASAEDCLQGEWAEDMENTLAQWQTGSAAIAALPITTLTGQNTLTVDANSMVYEVSYTTTISGLGDATMTGESEVSGAATLDYEVASATAMTLGPMTDQSVEGTTKISADGALISETPIEWDGGLEGAATWRCEGDSLSIQPAVSGWTYKYTRN